MNRRSLTGALERFHGTPITAPITGNPNPDGVQTGRQRDDGPPRTVKKPGHHRPPAHSQRR